MPHKLLLADDSVTIQRVIELTFADEDVDVVAVGDGKQAIERLQQDRPDIVLADIGMPERDGYEVASFIKGNPQLAHIPVLLLTGAFEPIDETRARSVGCDGVLVKPFEPQMVINRVRDLLAGRKPAGLWAANPALQAASAARASAAPVPDVELHAAPAAAAGQKAGTESLEDYFDRLDAAFGGKAEPAAPAAPAPVAAGSTRAPEPVPVAASQPDYGFREAASAPAASPSIAPAAHGDVLGDWDPELSGDPVRPSIADAPSRATVAAIPVTSNPPAAPRTSAPAAGPLPATAQPSAGPRSTPAPIPVPAASHVAAPPPAPAIAQVSQMPSLAEAFAALLSAEQGQPVVPAAAAISDDHIEEIARRVIDRMGDDSMRRAVLDVAERLVREEIARIKGR